jgi:anthranilate phosphoribosyltransferase
MITDSATDRVMRSCIQKVAKLAGHDSAAIIRGIEGGVIPSLKQADRIFCYHGAADAQPVDLNPADIGIDQPTPAVPVFGDTPSAMTRGDKLLATVGIDAVSWATAAAGLEAPQGKPGAARDSPVYAGAIMLHHPGHHESLETAAAAVSGALDSGEALSPFETGRCNN